MVLVLVQSNLISRAKTAFATLVSVGVGATMSFFADTSIFMT